MAKDYELEDCLNGKKHKVLDQITVLGAEYSKLNQKYGADTWVLPKDSQSITCNFNSKENADNYAQELRRILLPFGANTLNIQVKQKDENWEIVVNKELLQLQLGNIEIQTKLAKPPQKTPLFSQHRIPTSSAKATFNAEVFAQIRKIENKSQRKLAMQQVEELPILLDNTIVKHLNENPTLAAALLAQSKEYIDSFWPKTPPEQMEDLQKLRFKPARPKPRQFK